MFFQRRLHYSISLLHVLISNLNITHEREVFLILEKKFLSECIHRNFVIAYPLEDLTAKRVCDTALIQGMRFQFFFFPEMIF